MSMNENSFLIGIDIGGSHITAALVDPVKKMIVVESWTRAVVNSYAEADEIMDNWCRCIATATGKYKVDKICFAFPGPFNYEEGICLIQNQHKFPHLYGLNIKQALAEKLGMKKNDLFFHNDAACFLQGEVFAGSVNKYETVAGLTLGTGLGTAIYKNGLAQSADCWNMPFRESIAEDYLSTRWFIKRFATLTGKTINGVKELAGYADEVNCIKGIYAEFGNNLAEFIIQFQQQVKAEAVVIGGNIVHAYPWFQSALENAIQKEIPGLKIEPSSLGEKATIMGAVSAWMHVAKRSGQVQK